MMSRFANLAPVRFINRQLLRLWLWIETSRRERADSSTAKPSRSFFCREGWYYLILACLVVAAAVMKRRNLLLILGGMLFGPLLFNWRLTAVALKGLRLRRKMPHGVCAGDLLVVDLELSNTRRRMGSWAVSVEERIRREGSPEDEAIELAEFFPYVPAGKNATRGYRGRLPKRGRYLWEPARLSTRFPFGLLGRDLVLENADSLLVFPRLGQLTQGWMKRRHESFEGTHRRERRHSRVSGDFYGVRDWRHGDSRRWIHWRSTARHGTLVVRQFEQHRNRDVALLLDLWQPDVPTTTHLENVELAVSFAATVVADVCRKLGSNVLLGTPMPEPMFVNGTASAMLLQDAMTRLALAEASSGDHLPDLLNEALWRIDPGTELVIVSTRDVDLDDRRRFASLWKDPARRGWKRRIRTVTTNDGNLDPYFQPE